MDGFAIMDQNDMFGNVFLPIEEENVNISKFIDFLYNLDYFHTLNFQFFSILENFSLILPFNVGDNSFNVFNISALFSPVAKVGI